jgi:chromate transporter
VVGVILNLALFFGFHVLWPRGSAGPLDLWAAALALLAGLALFRYQRKVTHVIAASALAGWAIQTWLV